MPADWIDSSIALRLLFEPGTEPGQLSYRISAGLVAALLAAALLWWFKSLPYHRSAEERLQEALDQSPAQLAASPAGQAAS